MVYMMMPNDTLFCYDVQKGAATPRFVLNNKPKDAYLILQELPQSYIASMWNRGAIVVDKASKVSHWVRLKNDMFGNITAPFSFSNGYFFAAYEPMQLADRIEKRLNERSCTEQDRKVLNELLDSLDENDNNVMFIGKLKK